MARETMDPELLSTCKQGDVENLKKLYDTHRHDYEFFLTRQVSSGKRNMLHIMLHYHKQHPLFLKEALEILPIQVVGQLICLPNSIGDNPLHQAAYRNSADTNARILVDAYKRSSDVVVGDDLPSCPPWRAENNQRKVPAQIAISCNHDEVAAFLVSVDPGIFEFVDADKLLRESILKGCIRTVNVILTSNYGYSIEGFDPRRIEEECLFSNSKSDDDKNRKLIQKHPELIRFKDVSGRSMLQYLVDENDVDAMISVLKIQPSACIETRQGQEPLLMGFCRKGNLSAIHAICALHPNCPQLFIRHEDQTTVLHIVKLENLKEYRSLLGIPEMAWLKNKSDALGRSPLITAIQEDNIYLAQALLEMDGIDVMDIKSPEGKTAAQMLKDKCEEFAVKWDPLYDKVKQTTSYIKVGKDLKEMRSTHSVVAALLATITFAAAFTIPGGFEQNNGDALLGQRASFIVFFLSDTYAMCCSMTVICSLIWSMVLDSEEARLLIDRSVFVLLQSLYGTLVAFMTGAYTMMSHKTLWVAIVVCVISSYVPILANRRILITVYKFVPSSRPKSSQPRPVKSSIDPTLSGKSSIDSTSSVETSMAPRMSAISVQG